MDNVEIVRACEPWSSVFARSIQNAWRNVMATVSIIGVPRRGERANSMHCAIRDEFRVLCDRVEPKLTLVEEPEGQGLDYLVLDLIETKLVVRWGRYDGVRINRNSTLRQKEIQDQGLFPFAEESCVPTVTLGYTVEDDYTEAGIPCWWLGRLTLVREGPQTSEFIHEVERFEKPIAQLDDMDIPSPRILERDRERREIQKVADRVSRLVG